jgi:hypothetical protein
MYFYGTFSLQSQKEQVVCCRKPALNPDVVPENNPPPPEQTRDNPGHNWHSPTGGSQVVSGSFNTNNALKMRRYDDFVLHGKTYFRFFSIRCKK